MAEHLSLYQSSCHSSTRLFTLSYSTTYIPRDLEDQMSVGLMPEGEPETEGRNTIKITRAELSESVVNRMSGPPPDTTQTNDTRPVPG